MTGVARKVPYLVALLPLPALCLLLTFASARGAAEGGESAAEATTPPAQRQAAYAKEIKPLLDQFCTGCHGDRGAAGGVNLKKYADVAALQKDQATWRKALTQVRERSMPPSGAPQPSPDQRDRLSHWLADSLDNVDPALLPKNPGRVLIRRLSRAEYNNTVRDLFGVTSNPADNFPADGSGGGGFDNNADTLFLPSILFERYLDAAEAIVKEAKPGRIFVARPGKGLGQRDAARKVLAHHAFRAYRRPVAPAEIDSLMRVYDAAAYKQGLGFEAAVKRALTVVLVSPNFLYRVEKERTAKDAYPLDDYELASRLSYFLWASTPDQTLLALAAKRRLRDPKVLDAQVRRLLADPKAKALSDSFAGQWLRVRELYTAAQPDPRRYPVYTPALRDAMYREVVETFHGVVREDRPLTELIDADYLYVNEELAKHYGIAGVTGPQMRRVARTDPRRGGVLTSAAVLTLTSYPQRTSPVLRGKWVLDEMLGTPPPPPPPNVGTLSADDATNNEGLTFRQRLEKHREKPACASCHNRMDPLGFGLENFDAVGRWREKIGDAPVDAAGTLASGETFSGPVELKRHLLAKRKEDFTRNLTEKMLAYALGRGLEPFDLPTVKAVQQAVEKDGYRSTTLIREIVLSYPFRYRKSG